MDEDERREHRFFSHSLELNQAIDRVLNEPLLDLSTTEKLDLVLDSWIGQACIARQEARRESAAAAATERTRQIEQLRHVAALLESDDPTDTLERLFLDGKWTPRLESLRRQRLREISGE